MLCGPSLLLKIREHLRLWRAGVVSLERLRQKGRQSPLTITLQVCTRGTSQPHGPLSLRALRRLWAASFRRPPFTYEGVTGNEHHIGPLGHLQLLLLGSGGGRRERRRRDHTHPQRQHRLQGWADTATERVSSGLPPCDDLDSVNWSNVGGTAKLQLPSGSEHAHAQAWSPALTLNQCKDHFNQISS